MLVVHELPQRIRFQCESCCDSRLGAEFTEALPTAVRGVRHVRSSPLARSLIVGYDGSAATRTALLALIEGTPLSYVPFRMKPKPTTRYLRGTVVSAAVLLAGRLLPPNVRLAVTWLMVAPTIVKGARALLTRGLSVEALDSAALSIALLRGAAGTAAATLTLLNLGNYLEATTSEASNDLLRRLLALPPARAWLETAGELREVAADELHEQDIVVVGPGEMIPVDGQVISGAATVNLASITGESVPIDREAGGRVVAGGVVQQGRLRVRAVRVGNATTTARIAAFIKSALNRKPTIQSEAERLAEHRVLLTLGLGVATFLLTRDLNRLASIFLVDYSCALKLGAPVAIKSALYRGAQSGILIKGGRSIEALAEVDTVVFDKTGTLTFGDLTVTDVVPIGDRCSPDELLALLASLEEHTTHPVAEAIVKEAQRNAAFRHIHHDEVAFIVAHGLISETDGKRIVVGSRHFLEEHEHVPFAPFSADGERLEAEGKLLLYAAIDGQPAGIVGLRDRPRPEAAAAMAKLRDLGVRTLVLLTGDREIKARALADDLGLDMVFADRRPDEKAHVVRDLQAAGQKVAFIGDGVNDAPALIAADVGIAMPRGADLTRATADVVLLRDDLWGAVQARALADETIGLIQSNFRWAVVLNTLLFIAAMTGRASPVFSTVAHNGVTIGTLVRALLVPQRSALPRV